MIDTCDWRDPGHDPYMGEVPAAIEIYTDIAPAVRARLRARMAVRNYDDFVIIERDLIHSAQYVYGSEIRSMHFGSRGKVCNSVSRRGWSSSMQVLALVYCEGDTCIAVPTICRNVSRIDRYGPQAPLAPPMATYPLPGAENAPSGPPSPPGEAVRLADAAPASPEASIADSPGYGPAPYYAYLPTASGGISFVPVPVPVVLAVPEPATWALMGVGLLVVLLGQRKNKNGSQ